MTVYKHILLNIHLEMMQVSLKLGFKKLVFGRASMPSTFIVYSKALRDGCPVGVQLLTMGIQL